MVSAVASTLAQIPALRLSAGVRRSVTTLMRPCKRARDSPDVRAPTRAEPCPTFASWLGLGLGFDPRLGFWFGSGAKPDPESVLPGSNGKPRRLGARSPSPSGRPS